MLTLGVVTDMHLGPAAAFDGKLRKLSHRAEPLARAFAATMREQIHPDLVVNLGDVIEDEAAASDARRYRRGVALLAEAACEVVHVAGNHDLIHQSPADLGAIWGYHSPGVMYRSLDRRGVHLVVLYSHERKGRDVALGVEQLAWLERDLQGTTLPVVVLMHHAAADVQLAGNRWFEGRPHLCLAKDRQRLRAILHACGKVICVLNGHLHWNHLALVDAIPYVTVQSLVENVEEDAPGRAAAAWAVVKVEGRGLDIVVVGEHPVRYQL